MEREAALETVWQILNGMGYSEKHNNRLVEEVDAILDDIPAANVRPVAKGTWVGIDDFPHEDWECDHCGCVVGNTDDPWNYYHFCPNCGAEMRPEPPKEEMSMNDCLSCDGRTMGWCAYCANYPPKEQAEEETDGRR